MKRVLIINGGYDYNKLFEKLGYEVVTKIEDATLVCFTGGADVSPHLYGDQKHPYTGNDPGRDAYETQVFEDASGRGLPKVGICRGAQFLNVMSGGRMYQHVENHTRSHFITDVVTGDQVYVSSTHHQMMMPSSEGVLVAFSNLHGERQWYEGEVFKRDISNTDYEVVYYPHTSSLCFQPHPEFNDPAYEDMQNYFSALLKLHFG